MKIDVKIKVNEEKVLDASESEVASGWVEVSNCIKFPIKVRKYKTGEGEQKMFVSYPQRRNGDKYEGVVYPHDRALRKEIEDRVLEEINAEVMKQIDLPEIEGVRISRIEKSSNPMLKGIASLRLAGITINGIMVKEGSKGMFIQMPQYQSGGSYKDTVYGTNSAIQQLIREAVLQEYSKKAEHPEKIESLKKEEEVSLQKDKTPGTEIDKFLQAFHENDVLQMLEIVRDAEKELSEAHFTENYNAVKLQGAVIVEEDRMLEIGFYNTWNPLQVQKSDEAMYQKIDVCIFEAGNCTGMYNLVEKRSSSLKNAQKNYEELLELWKDLTQQEKIEIPREHQLQKEKAPAVPKM